MHDLRHPIAEWKVRSCLIIYIVVLFEKPLERLVALDVIFLQAENLERLLLGHETALDTEALLGDLFAALVGELLGLILVVLLRDKFQYSLVSLGDRQGPDHLLEGGWLTLSMNWSVFGA